MNYDLNETSIRIYNSYSKSVELFEPSESEMVKTYVCGPTVYDYTHAGHGRTYVVFDALRRYFNLRGYNVYFIVNITDIDDKIINRANSEGRDWTSVVDEFTRDYMDVISKLNIKVDLHPRVSSHINEIIEFISVLIERDYAYVTKSGNVYFNVDKYPDYGSLSGKRDKVLWSQEEEFLSEKRNPYDFALWKAAKPGEPWWPSPWGRGRPGWHIECSVMSSKYLGSTIDIHGGGSDLLFPHHENERAQSESFFGKRPWVKYWVHIGLLTIRGDKMSKSLGNIVALRESFKKWKPEVHRVFYLSLHYRKPQDYSDEALEQANAFYERLVGTVNILKKLSKEAVEQHYMNDNDLRTLREVMDTRRKFHEALSNDFNTAKALSAVHELTAIVYRELQYNPKYTLVWKAYQLLKEYNVVLGVLDKYFEEVPEEMKNVIDDLLKVIVDVRKELRQRKLYDLADSIRSELEKRGVRLMDKGLETTWIIER
ncbi:MAG: cysteine--tRNA ligase [Sulfolobales archaeon]|nr:cysteine--tRNA ligase [Sulfolobales archaeon]MCX8198753.1 cysteine--tRNA ligase [Sulfolobales archaeon]MDW8169826.1 cysteine--tRNA ligase [Desulfurococcaceae archaeon]